MRKIGYSALFVLFSTCGTSLCAQSVKDLQSKGDRFFNKKDYASALENYLALLKINADDPLVNLKAGICLLNSDLKSSALAYIEKAWTLQPNVDQDINYHLGLAYQNNHLYDKAIYHFGEFAGKNRRLAEIANHKIRECQIGDSLSRHPAYVEIRNIGPAVNSSFHEISPLVSADGNTMIFTSNRSTDDYAIKSGTNFEDIYITYRRDNGDWESPKLISPNINSKYNDAAASLSPDGKTLFLYYESGAGDIYTSTLDENGWSKPVPLNSNINHPLFWETSACISADGKKLYFTSNRPGGYGELDIYVSELDARGQWGKAVNLGPTINTPLNEDAPFIHADGVTLYFSSDGHPSMGSNDIFRSEYINGTWTKPVNLGYPVNSVDYDGFFVLSPDKKTGYYSAFREEGHGKADIYEIKFLDPPPRVTESQPIAMLSPEPELVTDEPPAEVVPVTPASVPEPQPPQEVVQETPAEPDYVDPIIALHKDMEVATILKGKVIDEKTAAPLGATITLVDNGTRDVLSIIHSDPQTGDFELVIPHGGNYGVATERKGYLFNSINFNVPQFAEYQEIDAHIFMVKAEVGSKVILKNIFFDVGKADIRNESIAELEKVKSLLLSNDRLKVQINGHTDNTGNAQLNMALSLRRAEAVVNYLVEQGIDTQRLSARGFGAERPLVSNDDEEGGREINRRTEIEITSS